jgi:hypothetical protein
MRNAETILDIIRQRHGSLDSRLEIERLMSGLEGGCWKSAQSSNSLAAYPTAWAVLRRQVRQQCRLATRLTLALITLALATSETLLAIA